MTHPHKVVTRVYVIMLRNLLKTWYTGITARSCSECFPSLSSTNISQNLHILGACLPLPISLPAVFQQVSLWGSHLQQLVVTRVRGCHLTAGRKLVLVRLCTQHGNDYLGSTGKAFWSRRTSEFNEIVGVKIQSAKSVVEGLMKKYQKDIIKVVKTVISSWLDNWLLNCE